jgi:hypothetical protein
MAAARAGDERPGPRRTGEPDAHHQVVARELEDALATLAGLGALDELDVDPGRARVDVDREHTVVRRLG